MDGRAQLQTLAHAITTVSDVDAAWAGTGPQVDVQKHCGHCGQHQTVRLPFLRHVCRSCAAIWVPGICGDCAHTSITFTLDGALSPYASCGCGGGLRQVAYVPKPRVAVAPEVAAARKVVVEQRKRRATWTSRVALLTITAVAAVGGVQLVRGHHTAPKVERAPAVHRELPDDPSLGMAQRGRRAAARLTDRGLQHDVFACIGELPKPSASPGSPGLQANAAPGSNEFLAACLAG